MNKSPLMYFDLVFVLGFQLLSLSGSRSRANPFAVAMETENLNSNSNSPPFNFPPSSNSRPRLQVGVSYDRSRLDELIDVQNDEPVIIRQSAHIDLLIHCVARYPIEWKMSSHMFQKRQDNISIYYKILATRDDLNAVDFLKKLRASFVDPSHVENLKDMFTTKFDVGGRNKFVRRTFHPEEFQYHLIILVGPADGLFGYIGSCQSNKQQHNLSTPKNEPQNSVLAQRLDIFTSVKNSAGNQFFGSGLRFKIINRAKVKSPIQETKTTGTRSGFLIPCPLLKITKEQPNTSKISLVQISNGGKSLKVMENKYDPEAGFYLWEWEKIEGTFQCRVQSNSNSTGAKFGSRKKKLEERVTFEFIKNYGQYQNQDKEDWLKLTNAEGNEAPDFERSRNIDIIPNLDFDSSWDVTECDTKSNLSDSTDSEFIRIRCKTHAECDFRRICSSKLCHHMATKGGPCPIKSLNCFFMNGPFQSELLKCTLAGNHIFGYSFIGLDNVQYYINVENCMIPPKSALIRLEVQTEGASSKGAGRNPNPNPNQLVLYVDEPVNFTCKATTFLFTYKIILLLKYKDGTTAYFPEELIIYRTDLLSDKLEIKAQINVTKEMIGVMCLAPWSNSSDWIEEIQTFVVKESSFTESDIKDSGLSTGGTIGIVAAILVFGMTFLLTFYKYWTTRRKLRNLRADEINEFLKGNPEALKNAQIEGKNAHLLPFNKEYEVGESDFSIDQDKLLGSGEFGVVYKGKLFGVDVAIKTTKLTADVDFFKAFLKEIKVMTFIGQHPNVIQLLGTSTSRIRERVVFVLVELSAHGSLNSFLIKNKSNFVETLSSSQLFNIEPEKLISSGYINVASSIRITTLDLVKWCGQIAAGMCHLASKKIIHGDLAARNILLFDDYTAKISDFGLSRQLYTSMNYTKKEETLLPWRIMAPESLKYLQFSTKSDVWAFGVLAWEIFSLGAVPHSPLGWSQDFVEKLEKGLRLTKPNPIESSNEIYENMCDCWNIEPENRPDFEQLEQFYKSILCTVVGNESQVIYLKIE